MTIKFRSPVGTETERESGKLWPGTWTDATPHGTLMSNGIHTGADLNNNPPGAWDKDRFAPVYAVADGTVTFAGMGRGTWGKLVVLEHLMSDGSTVHSRYAHLHTIEANTGDTVACGKQIGTIGNAEGQFAYHLHFDMAVNDILRHNAQHWAGHDVASVAANYVDPLIFIRDHWGPTTINHSNGRTNGSGMTTALEDPGMVMYVQGTVLNVRPQATTDSVPVASLYWGASVWVSEYPVVESANRLWRRIIEGPFRGRYVAEFYDAQLLLSIMPPAPVIPPIPTNLRSAGRA